MNMRTMALAVGLTLVQGAVLGAEANGVKRTINGCTVTLKCVFTGPVESDLVIEEQFTSGWTIDTSSVQLSDLDAFWSTNAVPTAIARFAVPPNLATNGYVITYKVKPGETPVDGSVSGGWKMHLGGKLGKSDITGDTPLRASAVALAAGQATGHPGESTVETPVSIAAFEVLSSSRIKLSYAGLTKPGSLVVEGCENLGKPWGEVKREQVSAGNGSVELDAKGCKFYRMKLVSEEE